MVDVLPEQARKGRGAISNPAGRFEAESRRAVDDGWTHVPGDEGDERSGPPAVQTTVTLDKTRTIIAKNDSPDVPFDQSINPYRGCEHVM